MTMTVPRVLDLHALVRPRSEVLASKILGDQHRAKIEAALRASGPGELAVVDLGAKGHLTSSYFVAAFWPWWADQPALPLLANPTDLTSEELDLALRAVGSAAWVVRWDSRDGVREPRLLGTIDPGNREALFDILERGPSTASELNRRRPDEGIGRTAWNNRLALLFGQRLLRRERRGRELAFDVPWRIETHG